MGTTQYCLGDLVVTAYDEAAKLTTDERLASELAAAAVIDLLRSATRRNASQSAVSAKPKERKPAPWLRPMSA
jgi:hypothetical protein